jgi:signal transduction histidine kinase
VRDAGEPAAHGPHVTSSRAAAVDRRPLTPDEEILVQRVRWLLVLHWTGGSLLVGVVLVIGLLAPMPGGLHLLGALSAAVAGYTAATEIVWRLWIERRFWPIERLFRVSLNLLSAADIVVLMTATHFAGGIDAPGLAFCVIPTIVYGSFLPGRDVYAQTLLLSALLLFVFLGEYAGWIQRYCPPIPGYVCETRGLTLTFVRYVSLVWLACLGAYLSSFIGAGLRAQEANRRRLTEERARLAETRVQFVAQASHEFRTPLAVILAAAEALDRYGERMAPADAKERLGRIRTSVRQMRALLDEVLTVGRADAGQAKPEREPVDVPGLCAEVVGELGVEGLAAERVAIACRGLDGPVPLDPKLARQIVRNLVSNAIKYSPVGGGIDLGVSREGGMLAIRVADHGIGIPAEDLARLFDVFHRGTNVGDIPGSGLGLAITQRAVTLLGGTISTESAPGRGTTFTVLLPVAPGTGAADTRPRAGGASAPRAFGPAAPG